MKRFVAVLFGLLVFVHPAWAEPPEPAVATPHPEATEAAMEVLNEGGNAFDAAVTVTAVLGVVAPSGSGLGGGGFFLLHDAESDRSVVLDARETAPGRTHRDLYTEADPTGKEQLSLNGPLAAGIPGIPAALDRLAGRYGNLPLEDTLEPAIEQANKGFEVTDEYRRMAEFRLDVLRSDSRARTTYLDQGEVPDTGTRIRQPDLVGTLKTIARHGSDPFYTGSIAREMVEAVRDAGGIWCQQDLADYRVIERQPIEGHFGELHVTAPPPPSAGGVGLAGFLRIIENLGLRGRNRAEQIHLQVEAMKQIYRDRAEFLGDPDFIDVPVERLISRDHARNLAKKIDPDRAIPSRKLPSPVDGDGTSTSHFSILDTEGNRVAATLSINYPFGSGVVAGKTGVLLNNEMDDFATRPGTPNAYGLIEGEANAVEPGKRPLSSMTPAFLEHEGRIAILGTPGGSRIVTMLMLAALEFARGGDAEALVNRPRFHHQYLPDEIQHEPDVFEESIRQALRERGHDLSSVGRFYGDMQVVIHDRNDGTVDAAADLRGRGTVHPRDSSSDN